jgi:hypothetical protein
MWNEPADWPKIAGAEPQGRKVVFSWNPTLEL